MADRMREKAAALLGTRLEHLVEDLIGPLRLHQAVHRHADQHVAQGGRVKNGGVVYGDHSGQAQLECLGGEGVGGGAAVYVVAAQVVE
jgi:hypothetical protein